MASAADLRGALPCPVPRRRAAVAAALTAALLLASAGFPAGASASGPERRRVCVARTVVVESPNGFTVGYLYRRDRVTLLRRSANRRWARIVTPNELRGWVRATSLCRP